MKLLQALDQPPTGGMSIWNPLPVPLEKSSACGRAPIQSMRYALHGLLRCPHVTERRFTTM